MRLVISLNKASGYKSQSQIARILTEKWMGDNVFCPNCGHVQLGKYENNRPVADFYCSNTACREDYELKSKRNSVGRKVVDGTYKTKIDRLRSGSHPNLFVLAYQSDSYALHVLDLFVVPKYFFVPWIIEKRKPLKPTARRAGWVGSNILLHNIPRSGKVFLIEQQHVVPKEKVLKEWQRTLFLRQEKVVAARTWLLDVMRFVEELGQRDFSLNDIYKFEDKLAQLHPRNKHIKDKIRQQLQILRDRGYLEFVSHGHYRSVV